MLRPVLRARGEDPRAQAELLMRPRPLVVEVDLIGDVPLVEDDRGRAAGLHRQLRDAEVLGRDPGRGVADDERDVRALCGTPRAQRGVVLERLPHLRLPAQSGGVDEDQLLALERHRQVDRIPGGAGDRRDDHPLGAEEAIDERGLADVGTADDSEANRVLLGRLSLLGRRWPELDDPVEQIPGAETLGGGDGNRVAEAEGVELRGERDVDGRVDLVRCDDHRHRRAPEQVGHLQIARPHARRARRRQGRRPGRRRAPPAPGPGSRWASPSVS